MDAIDFIKEKVRMCYSFGAPGTYHCDGCLLENIGGCSLEDLIINDNVEEAISLVEGWAALNPRTTYQSILLKNYPLARADSKNTLYIFVPPIFMEMKYALNSKLINLLLAGIVVMIFGIRR